MGDSNSNSLRLEPRRTYHTIGIPNPREWLYLGQRKGSIKYKHQIATRVGEFIFSMVFENYRFSDKGELTPFGMHYKLSSTEKSYLEERLKKAGL